MNPRYLPLLLTVAATFHASGADPEPIYTEAVGFVKLGNPNADESTPAVTPFTDVRLSIPLESELVFSGTFASALGDIVTVSGAPGWNIDDWAPTSDTTYTLIVTSGPEDGLRGLISENTANSVTVDVTTPGDLSNIGADNSVEIRKAWTLKSLLSSDTADLTPGVQALFFSGTEEGINLAPSIRVVWNGSNWLYITGAPNPAPPNANGLIIHPGESFIVRTGPNAVASMAIFGDVPLANHRSAIEKFTDNVGQDTTIGYFGPTPELLSESGLGFAPGDRLLVYNPAVAETNKAPFQSLVFSGSAWFGLTGIASEDVPSFALQPGAGYVFRQAASTDPTVNDWHDAPGPPEAP